MFKETFICCQEPPKRWMDNNFSNIDPAHQTHCYLVMLVSLEAGFGSVMGNNGTAPKKTSVTFQFPLLQRKSGERAAGESLEIQITVGAGNSTQTPNHVSVLHTVFVTGVPGKNCVERAHIGHMMPGGDVLFGNRVGRLARGPSGFRFRERMILGEVIKPADEGSFKMERMDAFIH